MNSKTNTIRIFFALIAFAAIFSACQKSGMNRDTQKIAVYLTDHPADFEKVLVQITLVEAKIDSGCNRDDDRHGDRPGDFDDDHDDDRRGFDEFGQWDTLDFRPGTYDLLTLRNGVDTLLATGTINGKLRKIRISVGAVNVVKAGVTYPVNVGPNNYLYIHVRDEHMSDSSDHKRLWIDFDVARSIREVNGQFYLYPVLKPFCDRNFGEVEGLVLPLDAKATVTVFNNTDTATAIPDAEGRFKIRGMNEGTYTVEVSSANGYKSQTLTNIRVSKVGETRLPVITLTK